MKNLKQLFATFVLVIALANAASATEGVMYPWIAPPPPPPAKTDVSTSGSIDSGKEAQTEDTTVDLMTETTLSIVQNLLALF